MKVFSAALAVLATATVLPATVAAAQDRVVVREHSVAPGTERVVVHEHTTAPGQERVVVREHTAAPVNERVVVRQRTEVRHDFGWHNGWRNRTRCGWRWRGHHRVRVCRTWR